MAPSYAYALRCIGQNLEHLDLKSIEIKLYGNDYVIQGWTKKHSNSMDVERRYTPDEIRLLDEKGRAQRKPMGSPPNLLALPQVLRFCGNYVDRLGGRLTRISWQDQSDKIQSVTIQFEPAVEGRDPSHHGPTTVEELCIHVYKQRKKITSGVERTWQRSIANNYNDL